MADAPESNPKIDSLRAKFEADPKSRHFYPLAEELRKIGQLEEAEKVLRTGLEHHSSYLSAWISLGRVLKDRAAYPEAVDVLMRALSLDPENVVAAKLLAHVYLGMGDKVEAIKKFKLVHALMPADEEAEEQIAALERELNPPDHPAPPPAEVPSAPTVAEESPHDSTEPPFQLDDSPEIPPDEPLPAAPAAAPPVAGNANFDLTNPDPFALGDEVPAAEPDAAPEPELADEAAPFADTELPETPVSGVEQAPVPEEDPFASVPGQDETPAAPQRAPSSEDVWAEDEGESGDLPESAATVTMAQILAQQGDVERARSTYMKVLEREPGNEEARSGLESLTVTDAPRKRSGGRVERLQAWRRKVAGS